MQELEDMRNYNFGLNEHHQKHIMNYLKFARHQRMQAMKAVEYSFRDVIDSRLLEDTYTGDEVRELLAGLLRAVQGDVETELMDTAHSNTLLLKQLFSQAEAWHLRLQPDLSELRNRQEMEVLRGLEEKSHLMVKPCSPSKLKLAPLVEGSGAAGLLRQEIETLAADNARLAQQLAELEHKHQTVCSEAEKLKEALEAAERSAEQTRAAYAQLPPQPQPQSACVNKLEAELGQLRGLSADLEQSVSAQERLQNDLSAARQQVAAVRAQLTLAEQELERKFSETAAYANVKKMLSKKNEQIKELRAKLQALEPSTDPSDEAVA